MTSIPSFDIIIVGGGIAGLWTLAQLREVGFNAILLEKDQLGGGQSMASQGIIHGGSKYALAGVISPATNNISQMPATWQQALDGKLSVDLRGVNVLSPSQFLVPAAGIETRLLSFLGSKSMASFTETVKGKALPNAYTTIGIKHSCFRLNEMVLDTESLFNHFYQKYAAFIFQADVQADAIAQTNDGITLKLPKQTVFCRQLVLAAGAGNGDLPAGAMQQRPLQMVMLEDKNLPAIYAHFIGRSSKPLLTITSHPTASGTVWYMGGDLAENGVGVEPEVLIQQSKTLLQKLLPQLTLTANHRFNTLSISRAEPQQSSLLRPDDAHVVKTHNIIAGWPTKLALAPRFAEKVQALIDIAPSHSQPLPELNLAKPKVAALPWMRI